MVPREGGREGGRPRLMKTAGKEEWPKAQVGSEVGEEANATEDQEKRNRRMLSFGNRIFGSNSCRTKAGLGSPGFVRKLHDRNRV